MESNNGSIFPIKQDELTQAKLGANNLLKNVTWTPKISNTRTNNMQSESAMQIINAIRSTSNADQVSIVSKAKSVSDDKLLVLNETVSYCLDILRKGLSIGMHSANLYSKATNFHTLIGQQNRGELRGNDIALTEFRQKHTTTSAIVMFVTANYIVDQLSSYKTDEIDSVKMHFEGLPEELHLANFTHALNYMMYYYGKFVSADHIRSGADFVKITILYFKEILNEIEIVKDSLQHTESFTNKTYKLEGEDFLIDGFNTQTCSDLKPAEFNRLDWSSIVGNTLYKHSSRRTIQYMMCYCPKHKINPMNELGGFPGVTMEYGPAGTGKSMGIAATATELSDRCKDLGIPFLYHPIPQSIVSTYQGGSSENMNRWFGPLNNPEMIVYAPIDDGDGKLRDRGAKGTSSGVIEVVESFLVNTEGASASKRGNRVIQLYTNLPETLDAAVLSRVQKRSLLAGAVTVEDFIDQDYLWWNAYEEMIPGFIGMENPQDYEFLSAQDIAAQLTEKLEESSESKVYKIQQILENTYKKHNLNEHMFFGLLYTNVKKEFPNFTSRDVRNIQAAVNTRLNDFDFPDKWMTDHAVFYSRPPDVKLQMLRELMKENMGELSFKDVRLQEVLRYLDNMATIVDKDFEKQVAEVILRNRVQTEANRRINLEKNG